MASVWDQIEQQSTSNTGSSSIWDQIETGRLAPPPKPPSRGLLGAANDYVIEAANAILGGGKALIDFAVPGTELANQIESLIQQGVESQSQVAQEAKQRLGEDIEAGGMQALKGVGSYVLENPALALSQAAGSFAIPFGAIRGTQLGARALGVGERAAMRASDVGPITSRMATAAGEKAIERVGTGAGVGIGAALGAGEAGGDAYGQVYEGLIQQGVSPEEADRQATEAARLAMPLPALVGGIAGKYGAERAVAAGTRRGSILRMAGSEAGQEFAEEGSTKLSANLAAGQYIDGIDPMKGVLGSAALGAALGGITGAAIGTVTPLEKQPGSLLGGANDRLQGSRTPSGDAIRQAINTSAAPNLPSVIPVTSRGEAFVSPEQQQAYQQFGQMAGRVDTAVPGRTIPPTAPAGAAQPPSQPAARVQPPQAQPVSQEEYVNTATAYGLTPVTNVANAWDLGGARIYGQPTVKAVIEGLVQAARQSSPAVQMVNSAILAANALKLTGNISNARPVINALNRATQKFGLVDVASVDEAVARINDQIANLAVKGKPATDQTVEQLDAIHTALTGQSSPLYIQLLEGVTNESQQQAATGVGTVSKQAGTTATTGTTGRTDAGSVQSLLAGSVAGGPPSIQNVAAGVGGTRGGAIVAPAGGSVADGGAVSGQVPDQGQVDGQETTTTTPGQEATAAQPVRTTEPAGVTTGRAARDEAKITAGRARWEEMNDSDIAYDDLSEQDQIAWDEAVAEKRETWRAQEQLANEYQLAKEEGFAQQVLDRVINRVIKSPNKARYFSTFLAAGAKQNELIATATENAEKDADGNLTEKAKAGLKKLQQGLSALRGAPNAELAAEYGVKLDTLKEWNSELRTFIADKQDQLRTAFTVVAIELRLENNQLQTFLQNLATRSQESQADLATTVQPDEVVFDERDLVAEDANVTAQDRTAASVQEVYNASETVNARYLRLQQELIDAENDGNQTLADEITEKLDVLAEEAAKLAAKQTGKRVAAPKKEKPSAVQKPSAKKVSVQPRARGGEEVGQRDTEGQKAAGESQAKTETKGEVVVVQKAKPAQAPKLTPAPTEKEKPATQLTKLEQVQAKYNELRGFAPDLIPTWDMLTQEQQDSLLAIDNPADINFKNLEQITDESKVIDVEAREVPPAERRLLLEQTNSLNDSQIKLLETHYGDKAGTDPFLSKLSQDIANYVNKGAEFVAARIRGIIAQLAKAAVAVAVIFNPSVQQNGFDFNLPDAYAKAKQISIQLPTEARGKMSPLAQAVFTEMAATAQISGKGFIIADKPNGMIHVFDKDGNPIAQDTALYGKDVGDVLDSTSSLEGGKKVTPAGKYALEAVKLRDDKSYAGGYTLDLVGTNDGTGSIAIHAAYLGNVKDKRLERLASADAKDNRISYGCINTSHGTFLNKIIPNIDKLDGGMVFVLPDNPETFSMPLTPTAPKPAQTPRQNAMRRRAEEQVQEVTGSTDSLMIEDASLDEMAEAYPGIAALRDRFNALGIGNAFNAVGQFFVSYNKNVDWDGIITNVDQKVAVVLRQDIAARRGYAMWTMAHEVGHAVDQAVQGLDTFSSDPRLNVRMVNGKIIPMGEVAVELGKLYKTNEDIKNVFGYPLDPKEVEGLSLNEIRQELFAQIWAFYTSGADGQRLLEQEAPATAKYMKEVIARVQETTDFQATNLGQERAFDSRAQGVTAPGRGIPGKAVPEAGQAPKVLRSKRVDENISRLPESLQPQATEIYYTLKDWASKFAPTFAFTQDLVDMAKSKMKSVTTFIRLYNEQQAVQTEYELRVKGILDDYDALPANLRGTGPGSVNAFIKKSTMSGKWGYKIKEEADVEPDPDLKAEFDAFPKEAQKVIQAVFKHGYDILQDMKRVLRENTNTEFDALIEEARAAGNEKELADLQQAKDLTLKNYQKLFALQGKKPYAPLKRFGNYVVVGKSQRLLDAEEIYKNSTGANRAIANKTLTDLQTDPQHYYVGFAETAGQGQVIANQLRRQFPDLKVTDPFEKSAQESLYGGSDLNQVFARLRNLADENLKASDKDVVVRGVRKMILDLQTQMLGNQSIMHATNRRLGIAGADDDMMRSFATQGRASAHFIGSLSNTGKIYEQLRNMSRESKNDAEARRYFNELVRRHAMGFDYDPSPVLNKAMSVTSLWMLLTSPAYYLQNMTQPIMMSVPYIAGRYGYAATQKEMLTRAYPETMALLKNLSLKRPGEQVDFSDLPEDVRGMVEDLVKRGRIQITLDRDLGEFTSGEDSAFKKLGKTSEYLRSIAEKVELVNRVATAITAYRVAIANQVNESEARNYADKVIRVTHGDYSGANAPRFMRKGAGRLITQFRKFQLIQISMMVRLLNDATRGANADEKRAARMALVWTLTHAGVAGGIMGLPGFAAAAALYGMLFADEDEPFDAELELRKYFGDEIGTLMTKGLPAQFGVDLSGKIGMGQMLSILPYSDFDLSRAGWQETVTAAMGPFIGGLAPRVIDGVSYWNEGNYYKFTENVLPKGVADTLKAVRFATEGVTQRNNDVSLSPDEISTADAVLQALGLPTTKLTERQFRVGVSIKTEEFFDKKTASIKRDYVKAYKDNDVEKIAEARDAWKRIQDSRVASGFKRQPLSNLLKAPQEQAKRERQTVGGVQYTQANRRFVESLPQ